MSTATRFEKGYLLQLLREANLVLRELQENTVVLPAAKGPRRSMLKLANLSDVKTDKSAWAKY